MAVTLFHKSEILARGVAGSFADDVRLKATAAETGDIFAFDDESGRQIDVEQALFPAPRGRGRPALGVEAKEVTLLPRHWDWLSAQPGGASVTLRKLVEAARRAAPSGRERLDAAYRFLTVMAGDLPGYEEAIRALYADDRTQFDLRAREWPVAVADHARLLAWPELEA